MHPIRGICDNWIEPKHRSKQAVLDGHERHLQPVKSQVRFEHDTSMKTWVSSKGRAALWIVLFGVTALALATNSDILTRGIGVGRPVRDPGLHNRAIAVGRVPGPGDVGLISYPCRFGIRACGSGVLKLFG